MRFSRWTVTLVAVVTLLIISLVPPSARAQSLEFEVATIKPTVSHGGVRMACHGVDSRFQPEDFGATVPLGRCVVSAGLLSHLMVLAYGIARVDGAVDWATTGERFDVQAKAEDPAKATESQLLAMFQHLLVERFKLKFHHETRDINGFSLAVATGGPKLRNSSGNERTSQFGVGPMGMGPGVVRIDPRLPPRTITTLEAKRFSIADLIKAVWKHAGGPILDETQLAGLYDFTLTWEEEGALAGPLKDQLGLHLAPRKLPLEFLIVDSAERPDLN